MSAKPINDRCNFFAARHLGRAGVLLSICFVLIFGRYCFAADDLADSRYHLLFELEIEAGDSLATATIALNQPAALLHEVRFRAPAERFRDFSGDGQISRRSDIVVWMPPETGGSIKYTVEIDHLRDPGEFDALVSDHWAMFRGDDIFPPASIRQKKGALPISELALAVPADWSVAVPFPAGPDGRYLVNNPKRIFDRPTGWILVGQLGIRRDEIAGIKVSVAAPVDIGAQRISMLALLNWTLPFLTRELDQAPDRISVVAGPDPMWRGGLSAPNSVYVHAERPLLSENGTSTLLHELIHLLMPISTDRKHDWIDEGIAEYLTLVTLQETGTISHERFDAAIAGFKSRGNSTNDMATDSATGKTKAKAVAIFYDLDIELQKITAGETDLFDLTRRMMMETETVDIYRLRELAIELAGIDEIDALATDNVPGF